jgi:hypothetical protein
MEGSDMRLTALSIVAAVALPALAEAQTIKCDRFGCGQWKDNVKTLSRSYGARPAGCPRRYCGCAMSIRVFGRKIPRLYLAANWLRFPRARPRPGIVAARRGHVMQLLVHVTGHRWRVYDPNSGRGLTRIHVRSVRGFAFVDPTAQRYAGRLPWQN